jgi:hypothetical protein
MVPSYQLAAQRLWQPCAEPLSQHETLADDQYLVNELPSQPHPRQVDICYKGPVNTMERSCKDMHCHRARLPFYFPGSPQFTRVSSLGMVMETLRHRRSSQTWAVILLRQHTGVQLHRM